MSTTMCGGKAGPPWFTSLLEGTSPTSVRVREVSQQTQALVRLSQCWKVQVRPAAKLRETPQNPLTPVPPGASPDGGRVGAGCVTPRLSPTLFCLSFAPSSLSSYHDTCSLLLHCCSSLIYLLFAPWPTNNQATTFIVPQLRNVSRISPIP